MCLCSPILLSSLQHLIWNPNGAFEHEVKESGRPVTSLLQWQISLNWLPGPDLALLPPSNHVYSTSMCLCSPILLSSLQHLIWNPNGAFEHEVKEWKAITSLLQWQISQNWLPGPDLALLPPSNRVYSTSMCLCSPILLSSLQHLIWNPNGAFEHEVKEWKACYLPFTMSNISKLTTWARFGTFATFESRLLHQHVFVLPNSFKLIATSYMEPKWSLWAWSEGVEGLLPPFYNVKYL